MGSEAVPMSGLMLDSLFCLLPGPCKCRVGRGFQVPQALLLLRARQELSESCGRASGQT